MMWPVVIVILVLLTTIGLFAWSVVNAATSPDDDSDEEPTPAPTTPPGNAVTNGDRVRIFTNIVDDLYMKRQGAGDVLVLETGATGAVEFIVDNITSGSSSTNFTLTEADVPANSIALAVAPTPGSTLDATGDSAWAIVPEITGFVLESSEYQITNNTTTANWDVVNDAGTNYLAENFGPSASFQFEKVTV